MQPLPFQYSSGFSRKYLIDNPEGKRILPSAAFKGGHWAVYSNVCRQTAPANVADEPPAWPQRGRRTVVQTRSGRRAPQALAGARQA